MAHIINQIIATNLTTMMNDQNLTVNKLAEKSNISESSINSFVVGRGGHVSDLFRIADVLAVQPASLMTDNVGNLEIVLRVLLAKQSASPELTVGAKIAKQRRLMVKTQADLAKAVKLPRQEISRIEHDFRDPTCDVLAAIAEALECPISVFLPFVELREGDVILATQIIVSMLKTS